MTKTTRYIAVTAADLVETGSMCIIWGLSTTPELAIANANECSGSDEGKYDVLPASDRLADYVEKYGAEPELEWTHKNAAGVADLLDDEENEVAEIENGSSDDLLAQLIKAGIGYDEEDAADVLYVQLDRETGWTAAFAPSNNHHEHDMTHWSTGEDVAALFAAITEKNVAAIQDYASGIIAGWDSDWTN